MDAEEIMDTLTSYADGLTRVMQNTDLDVEEITEMALDNGIEQCPCCGWWAESGEMIPLDGDEPDGHCENCR